jgi:hypothetical protein
LKTDFPSTFKEGFQTHLVASAIAGFCCSAASNPVDVIKVRLPFFPLSFFPLLFLLLLPSFPLALFPPPFPFTDPYDLDSPQVRMMTDKTGQFSNAFQCAALLLKNEGSSTSLSFFVFAADTRPQLLQVLLPS